MELIEIRLRVLHDLVAGLERPALVEIARVADLRRPVTDDEHDLVAPLRQLS